MMAQPPRTGVGGDGAAAPDPSGWGQPYAQFHTTAGANSDCPASHFVEQQLIFDITLCGQYAVRLLKSLCCLVS
jgi:hypothetical protein